VNVVLRHLCALGKAGLRCDYIRLRDLHAK
jgi:hypothetical protein